MSAPARPEGDLRERIVAAVRDAKKPVTFKGLAKLVKVSDELLRMEVESAANAGQIYRWAGGRSQSYWNVSSDEKVRESLLAAAAGHAFSRAALSKTAAKALPGFSGRKVEPYVTALAGEKKLQTVPAFSGSAKLYIQTGDREAYVQAAHAFAEAKIRAAGFAIDLPEASRGAGADVGTLIVEAVRSLETVPGVPVSTRRLRHQLRSLSKQEFDSAALELRQKQQVILSQHVDPYNASEEEKEELIDGQDGTYYVAVTLY
jgi:hypothetical protein